MTKLRMLPAAIGLFLASSAHAAINAPVNIVYPIHGSTQNNYITASFSATCPGGQHTAVWGFDSTTVGNANFYDQFTAQFSHKLPSGGHTFWVKTSCGYEIIKFGVN